jgi:hypothetical protein
MTGCGKGFAFMHVEKRGVVPLALAQNGRTQGDARHSRHKLTLLEAILSRHGLPDT